MLRDPRLRAVVQRVMSASVAVDGSTVGRIGPGLLVYLGAERGDREHDVAYVADKVAGLRVFEGEDGKMTRSLLDTSRDALVVSQFTLFGDVRRGRRPSFEAAAPPAEAESLYASFLERLAAHGLHVERGRFRADMRVHAEVDGPVTILLDSRKLF